jgi:hypothetical protein
VTLTSSLPTPFDEQPVGHPRVRELDGRLVVGPLGVFHDDQPPLAYCDVGALGFQLGDVVPIRPGTLEEGLAVLVDGEWRRVSFFRALHSSVKRLKCLQEHHG